MKATRRQAIQLGGLSLLGRAVSPVAAAPVAPVREASAKRVVMVYLQGGAPTQDMYDMKPECALEFRSEFTPVPSTAAGIDVCELMPRMAKLMHKTAVVRSAYHDGGCHKNMPMYTGKDEDLPDEDARSSDPPSMGSVIHWHDEKRGVQHKVPPYVFVPCALGWGENRVKGGPHGGFLGHQYDPFSTTCNAYVANPPDDDWNPQPVLGEPIINEIHLQSGVSLGRLGNRRQLLNRFDDHVRTLEKARGVDAFNVQQRVAFDLLTSPEVKAAFDFKSEPDKVRDRYGRTLFGTSALLGRRLVEAGSRFINVSYENLRRFGVSKASWDTHKNNFPMLKKTLLPDFDRAFSAFLEDLDDRGLLDETLVVVMGEMGRTPKINPEGGRDHWTHCYSVLLAGGGVSGGMTYGASDRDAMWIKDRPVHIRDICATIYHALGIDPHTLVYDRANRPVAIARGGLPVTEIF